MLKTWYLKMADITPACTWECNTQNHQRNITNTDRYNCKNTIISLVMA